MNVLTWIKNNWLIVLLLGVIAALLGNREVPLTRQYAVDSVGSDLTFEAPMPGGVSSKGMIAPSRFVSNIAPVESANRLVVQDTNLSMLVKDVPQTIKGIEAIATQKSGYMVEKSLVKPEEAASGHITLRVPATKREETLDEIRALGVRVISENVFGEDVTDQYVDTETRIANLEKLKNKMEAILEQAIRVTDLMEVQAQINQIQDQIDGLKGQQKFLEQTAKLTRITVNLSTDELALPYAPDNAWRPAVVFKTAVRSMIGALRNFADAVIWMVVYLPVILIILGLLYLARVIFKRIV